MKTIHKFPVEITDEQWINIPKESKILCFQVQNNEPYIWAQVDTNNPNEELKLLMYGTGHRMPEFEGNYIGTIQHEGFVWHLFCKFGIASFP